jgi:AcrR family transcriptional regulator
MPPSPKKSGRPRSAQSHQAILAAALALLSEVGFEAMSIEAIATRAAVGKSTIYRRYKSKEELVADAIETIREEIAIPDTGSLLTDIDALIESAAQITLSPLGRQSVAMIISSAASNPRFAQIYWTKYLQPRREAFSVVVKRAQDRNEVQPALDPHLVFDTMSAIMLYALIFPPEAESWQSYVRRSLQLFLASSLNKLGKAAASID